MSVEAKKLNTLVANTKKLKVLYVEDDRSARETTLTFFKSIFANIDIAVDGDEAWSKFQDSKYDIIITDINLPHKSGIELIEHIREVCSSTPILVLSAYDNTKYFLQSIKFGVDGYLLKPIDMEAFIFTISKIVAKLELERSILEYQNELEQKVKLKTKKLKHRCFHEFYTDLPNSIMLHEDLNEKECSHLLLLDMSHFSTINKEYGKTFANLVIKKTALVLQKHIHKKAKLYKVESDRFVILLKDATQEKLHDYCAQIISFFDSQNVMVNDAEIHITFNIGIAQVYDNISETLINSEYALDKSKKIGSRNYEIYNANDTSFTDEKEAVKSLKITRKLVSENKIEPYFQPIKDVTTNKIRKYEVLARGILDDKVIMPAYFIGPAEKLGFITSITRIIINKSFDFFKNKDYEFSINITERDLLEGYLIPFLKEKISLYGINPINVTFEILENITISKNSKKITKQLNALRDMGFKIAIDDFGIENSNFSRLLEINIDFIKLDGIFIKNLKYNERNRTITKAIVNLAKTLGIKTVAEFVEDEEVYNIVKKCGIDYAQGYYIGKPQHSLID